MSKTKITIIFAAAVILLGMKATSARAATYYIDASGGSDTNAGTDEAHPWKSASKASGTFSPGDNISFKRGETWNSGFTVNSSGASDNPITFTSYGSGDKPKFHPTTILAGWSGPDANGVYTLAKSACPWLMEDGIGLPRASDPACSNGNWYFQPSTIYYKPTAGVPGDHVVERVGNNAINFGTADKSNIVIDGLHMEACDNALYNSMSYSINNITVKNCHIERTGAAMFLQTKSGQSMTGINIADNTFDHCGNNIYIVENGEGWSTVHIARNTMTNSNEAYGSNLVVGDREGLSLQNLKNSIIEKNEISGSVNCLNGIVHWMSPDFPGTGNIFRYNYIHDVIGRGIVHGGGDNGTANCKIYGNIITNFGKTTEFGPNGGLRLNKAQTAGTPSEVYNNTIYNGDVGIMLTGLTDHYIIQNNIIHTMSGYLVQSTGSISHNVLDNNLYYPATANAFRIMSTNYDFNGWKSTSGQDANSLTSDPSFINPSGNFSEPADFKLQAGSPAIDAGADVGLTADFEGTAVPQGSAPDIGAFEYHAGAPTYQNADINQDANINVTDLGILMSDFGKPAASALNPRSDINSDGAVNVIDLGILMSEWEN